MQEFEPHFLVLLSHLCGTNKRTVDEQGYPTLERELPESIRALGAEMMESFARDCARIGLTASVASIERLRNVYLEPNSTIGDMHTLMAELHGRLADEVIGKRFFSLNMDEAQRFDKWNYGWEEILTHFPDTTRDVEEMNKCFALSRYTAAMFHALHIAEWGAISLGDFIGVADPKKGWGPTEKKLKEIMKNGRSNLPAGLAVNFEFLEQMNREIDSMVLAWRHKVDHAANHLAIVPNTDFTPDIAEHVISAVRIFMLRLMHGLPRTP